MRNRLSTLSQLAVRAVDAWCVREAEARSRTLDGLLPLLGDVLPAPAPSTMGKTILFTEGSARLDDRARAALRDRSAVLRANPGIRVVIGGFAGQVGSPAYAMGLGMDRVQAVRAFVLSQGIEPARIEVAIRGAEWSLVEQPCRAAGEDPSGGECRIQIVDPQWALRRS